MATVCIDCRYIGPRPSGIAEVVQALVDFVPALAPDIRFVLLRHHRRVAPLNRAANVTEVSVPHAANGPATMWWLPKVVDLSGIDLFHAPANILPAGLTMPCITTVHDIMWLMQPQWCSRGALGPIKRGFYANGINRALRRSAAIATVSDSSRDDILAIMPPVSAPVITTRSGVATDFRPTPRNNDVLTRLGVAQNKKFVLTVGQYAPYKNHEGALAAFAAAFPQTGEIDLVLVQRQGTGSRKLLKLAADLGLEGRVHLLQALERSDLIHLYSAASALLHPSFCEGFGNPLAEAMACGCPVITSNISAMPEVTGGAAELADPRDTIALASALRKVVNDPHEAERMRAAGLVRAADLCWHDFAAANLEIYRRVLASR